MPLTVAISDGHGSAKCLRSDVSARLAVRVATRAAHDFLRGESAGAALSAIKRTAEERLPRELTRRWREAVEEALRDTPFSPEELDLLAASDGPAARKAVEANPFLAYGATLLAVSVAETFLLYFQLGDGDILAVTDAGEVSRPLPGDERLFANETTSLCAPQAWRDLRVGFQALAGLPPALILLATDGYANSFRDDAVFLKVGSDLLEMIRAKGLSEVSASLEEWLVEASQTGSVDDVTLGVICRMAAVGEGGALPTF